MNAIRKNIPAFAAHTFTAGLLAFVAFALPLPAVPPQLVSARNSSVVPSLAGNDNSTAPIMTPDGRYVLFVSSANNLTPGDNNLFGTDVFLRDRASNTTALVSANFSGTGGGNSDSTAGGLSTNGRFILFESTAGDLVPGMTNGVTNIFVRDMLAGTNVLVSVGLSGALANGSSRESAMTPDGRFVVFVSVASNLVAGDINGMPDVYVRDLTNQTTTLVSVGATATSSSNNAMATPVITPDGRYVAFFSTAGGLAGGVPSNTPGEIYVRNLQAGSTAWISSNAVALAGLGPVPSTHPQISDDGRFVVFKTGSTNGVKLQPPNNGAAYLFRHDSTTGSNTTIVTNVFPAWPYSEDFFGPEMTPDGRFIAYVAQTVVGSTAYSSVHVWDSNSVTDTLVSQDQAGNFPSNTFSDTPVMTPEGRFVAFQSSATNLVANTVSNGLHSYVRDLQARVTRLLDVDTNGVGSVDNAANVTSLSTDGQFAAFCSPNDGLIASDNNHYFDVFVRDLTNSVTELVSARNPAVLSQSGRGMSSITQPSVSSDGHWLVFASQADDLVTNDFNGDQDVFVRDLVMGSNILVSVGMDGNSASGGSISPVMSGDGRYVAFVSAATNLVANDNKYAVDIFRRDLQTGATVLVSVGTNGAPLSQDSSAPAISQDGRYVVFLNQGIPSSITNVLLRDVTSGSTLVSLPGTSSFPPSLSANGRYIAYAGSQSKLLVWDAQLSANIYTNTDAVTSQAISPSGTALLYVSSNRLFVTDLNTGSNLFAIDSMVQIQSSAQWSANGRFCAFVTATNGAPGDNNNTNDVFLFDAQSGTVTLVSLNHSGTGSANGASDSPAVSGDGRFVVFRSFATDIVPAMANTNLPNLFVFDRLTGSNALVDVEPPGSSWSSWTAKPAISADGGTIAFQSIRPGLVPGTLDLNRVQDVFSAPQSPWVFIDSDGDGIPDSWMMQYFGHPTGQPGDHSRAQDDADGDGMSNLQEYLTGTNPTDPASVFRLQLSPVIAANSAQFSWPTLPGKSFKVQYKANINDPVWLDFPGNVWVMENRAYFTTAIDGAQTSLFYRIVEVN